MNNGLNNCVSLMCLVACIWFTFQYCLHKNFALGSEDWMRVSGQMQTMTMQRVSTRRSYYYKPYVAYHFSCGGRKHFSNTISFPDPTFQTKSQADFFSKFYPEGGLISVYYDGKNPDHCCLIKGVGESLNNELWYAGVALFLCLAVALKPGRDIDYSNYTGSGISPSR